MITQLYSAKPNGVAEGLVGRGAGQAEAAQAAQQRAEADAAAAQQAHKAELEAEKAHYSGLLQKARAAQVRASLRRPLACPWKWICAPADSWQHVPAMHTFLVTIQDPRAHLSARGHML